MLNKNIIGDNYELGAYNFIDINSNSWDFVL